MQHWCSYDKVSAGWFSLRHGLVTATLCLHGTPLWIIQQLDNTFCVAFQSPRYSSAMSLPHNTAVMTSHVNPNIDTSQLPCNDTWLWTELTFINSTAVPTEL